VEISAVADPHSANFKVLRWQRHFFAPKAFELGNLKLAKFPIQRIIFLNFPCSGHGSILKLLFS